MPGKVFISCGQATSKERQLASEISNWFQENGYKPYVAIKTQSIQDVNSGIIDELKSSDYYIFIDFKREKLNAKSSSEYRGSLFTNQELAVAYLLGFQNVIFFQEKGIRLEGLLKYMASNATIFEKKKELFGLLKSSVFSRQWTPKFTRHLMATRPRLSEQVISYRNPSGRFLYIDIENRRSDLGAFDTVARLSFITYPNGQRVNSVNRSHLKVTGQPGFSQVIWPESHGAFDLLVVSSENPSRVYLNNALDVFPQEPIIDGVGHYELEYEVFAKDFPNLSFRVNLNLTGELQSTEALLANEVIK